MAEQLAAHGIESSVLARPLKQRGRDYWTGKDEEREFPSGTLVIDLAQSQGHLARALLEAGSDFEPEFVERQREQQKQRQQTERYPVTSGGSGFYDVTGWCLVFAHGLDAWTSSEAPAFERGDWKTESRATLGKQGAVLRYSDRDDILAAFDLLGAGVKVDIADDAMQLAGQRFPVGTFLVLRQNNQGADLTAALEKVAKKRGVVFEALDTAYPDKGGSGPGSTVRSLRAPRIGVIFGTGTDITSFGSAWFALERTFKLPLTPLTTSALDNPGDLTCIVCPPGRYPKASARLKDWVRAGGTLILLEDFDWALGQDGFVTLGTKNGASLPGSLFRARLNKRSLYTAGYDSVTNIAVPVSGSRHLKVKSEGGAVVSFEPKGERKKLLSGWEWEDTEDALADTVWMHDEPVGRGHVIFLAYDPTDRAMWPGLDKLLLNAMLFGP